MMLISYVDKLLPKENNYVLTKPLPQNFLFPSGIIYYLTRTPSSWKGYQKLLQTCKYFIFKNFYLIAGKFMFTRKVFLRPVEQTIYVEALSTDVPYKFWLTESLTLASHSPSDTISRFTKNIYRCHLLKLKADYQIFTYNEYLKLTESGSIEVFHIFENIIEYENGKTVPLECLLATLPNIVEFICSYVDTSHSALTSMTFKNMTEFKPFKKLRTVQIFAKSPSFDAKDLCDFIMKNCTNFRLNVLSAPPNEWFNIIKNYFNNVSQASVKKHRFYGNPLFLKSSKHNNWTDISVEYCE